ncbi:response regulator [Silvimonas amylolytica]|uniref:DNA-binding response regulator n=1 Tax=Silvimonas amylolytica TaxID=449663 RepID=A0ABQ2PG53_9NEIS|nr:response regulator transcription factor [Silvimonas amylolytica]GGP24407.1 DNA-binding response regulator [Silvimonas amylolytica]
MDPSQPVMPIRVMAVDDHPLMLEGIASVLGSQPDIELIATSQGPDAHELFMQHRPDVTLMDLQIPGLSGLQIMQDIRTSVPTARVIILTTYRGDMQAMRGIRAGAAGYVLKGMMRAELLDAIRVVHTGRRRIPAEVAVLLAEHVAEETLTHREIDVLEQVARGQSNRKIGVKLAISEETVKVHMKNILAKLGAQDRTHAVTIGIKRGILEV